MKRLWEIADTDGSNGINSCPTVIGFGDDDVILQGKKLDSQTRRRLNIPDDEDAIVMPRELYLSGAGNLTETG